MSAGRPTDYNQEIAEIICDLVATTTDSLDKICADNPGLPTRQCITRWRVRHAEFSSAFMRAKIAQADLLAESLDDIIHDIGTYIDDGGNKRVDSGYVAAQRLKYDGRKWLASKMLPKVYGDKQDDISAQNTLIEKLLEKL